MSVVPVSPEEFCIHLKESQVEEAAHKISQCSTHLYFCRTLAIFFTNIIELSYSLTYVNDVQSNGYKNSQEIKNVSRVMVLINELVLLSKRKTIINTRFISQKFMKIQKLKLCYGSS